MPIKPVFDKKFIQKIAALSKLEMDGDEDKYFSTQFNNTLETISDLSNLDISDTPEAYNITGLKNVFREDEIDNKRILSQKGALAGARQTHNGFFVVKGVLNDK